jgi:hypothetical protein
VSVMALCPIGSVKSRHRVADTPPRGETFQQLPSYNPGHSQGGPRRPSGPHGATTTRTHAPPGSYGSHLPRHYILCYSLTTLTIYGVLGIRRSQSHPGHRDSKTGQFVTKRYAKAHPETPQRESIPNPGQKNTGVRHPRRGAPDHTNHRTEPTFRKDPRLLYRPCYTGFRNPPHIFPVAPDQVYTPSTGLKQDA